MALRDRLMAIDERALAECVARYTHLAARSRRGSPATTGSTRRRSTIRRCWRRGSTPGPYGDYVLSVARLEQNKRVDLAVRSVARVARAAVARRGRRGQPAARWSSRRPRTPGSRTACGSSARVADDALVELYRGALGVVYVPFDEDYGLVTLEGFLAAKPVVTAADSGGTLEFVDDGVNGFVVAPAPAAIAEAVAAPARAARPMPRALGAAGRERAAAITWDRVIERLVAHG